MADARDCDAEMKLQFRELLVKVSREMQEKDLDNFKYLIEDEVSLQELEQAKSGISVFRFLQQKEIISPKNVGFLKRQMNTLGREDLKKLVEEYEATFHNDQPDLDYVTDGPDYSRNKQGKCVTDGGSGSESGKIAIENLKEIAKDIGTHWKMLARELNVVESDISAIMAKCPFDLHEQSYQALLKWEQSATNVSPWILKRALQKQRLNSIALKYFSNVQPPKSNTFLKKHIQ